MFKTPRGDGQTALPVHRVGRALPASQSRPPPASSSVDDPSGSSPTLALTHGPWASPMLFTKITLLPSAAVPGCHRTVVTKPTCSCPNSGLKLSFPGHHHCSPSGEFSAFRPKAPQRSQREQPRLSVSEHQLTTLSPVPGSAPASQPSPSRRPPPTVSFSGRHRPFL